jgi:hypothetical protein
MTAIAKQGIRDYLVNFSIPWVLFLPSHFVGDLVPETLFMGHFYGCFQFSGCSVHDFAVTIMGNCVPPTLNGNLSFYHYV